MPGRHNENKSATFNLHLYAKLKMHRRRSDVSFVPHVFVSRLLQCISHASQKHHPLLSYVPTVRPSGKCGCSLGSADLNERWNNTNLQEHETAPKRQNVDYGSVSQQNNAEEIDRARLPERVHEPKLTPRTR